MVRVTSSHLNKHDIAILRRFTHFVLNKFVRKSTLDKATINIKVITKDEARSSDDFPEMHKSIAICSYDGNKSGRKRFTVILTASQVNQRAKKPWGRLRNIMRDLAHELIHVKQYLNGEMFGYVSGDVRYRGEIFSAQDICDEENYYNTPWEIEAYGREHGLCNLFVKILKEEEKAKA